jgi:hypothetical protein
MTSVIPKTAKEIDAVVFRRVVKRLINDRVTPLQFEKYAQQARDLFEEILTETRYEKQFLTNPQPSVKQVKRMSMEEQLMEHYEPVLERLSKT